MTSTTFDTLAYTRLLTNAGFSPGQAEALTQAQKLAVKDTITNTDQEARNLATKADIAIAKAELKSDMAEFKASLIKWIVGSMLSLAAFLTAVVFGILAILPQLANFMRN